MRQKNSKEKNKRNLYWKEYFGLRESLARQIAKFSLIIKSTSFEIINFDPILLIKNKNNKNEIEYIWGGRVPKKEKRVLITFSKNKLNDLFIQ